MKSLAEKAYDFMTANSDTSLFSANDVAKGLWGSPSVGAVKNALMKLVERAHRATSTEVQGVLLFSPVFRSDDRPFTTWPQRASTAPNWWKDFDWAEESLVYA